MDGLLAASVVFLSTIFCIIAGFIAKLWFDERNSTKRRKALVAMGLGTAAPETQLAGEESETFSPADGNASDGQTDDENDGESLQTKKKIGKKKLAKLQAKAEAKAMREQELVEREERKKQEQEAAKLEEEKKLAEEEERKKRQEQVRLERELKERREQEEYLSIKSSFEVQELGFENEMDEEGAEDTIEKFLNFVRQKKVVHIDELASHFSIKPDSVVDRLNTFLLEGRVSGVFDDRDLGTGEQEHRNFAQVPMEDDGRCGDLIALA